MWKGTEVFSKAYRQREFEEVRLRIGGETFSKQDMFSKLENGHVMAARNVAETLKRLGVTTVAGILRIPLMDWARVDGFGEASLRILLDVLLWSNHSDTDIRRWLKQELTGHKLVQWGAICAQAAKKAKKRGRHPA